VSKVIGYIDGYNLYGGLRQRGWRQYYWIDPYLLIQQALGQGEELVGVKYFTARVKGPDDKRARQTAFLDAIRIVSSAEVILGKFYAKPKECRSCGCRWTSHEEKMTDSAIASNLVADAFRDQFDTAILVGGDTDIVPAIKMVRRWFPKKRLVVLFPPARRNQEVETHCHDSGDINGSHLHAALMPDEIQDQSGLIIRRPCSWSARPTP